MGSPFPIGYSTGGATTVSAAAGGCAAGTAGAGASDAHPVGRNTATSPTANAAAFTVFLLIFALIGQAFLLVGTTGAGKLTPVSGCYLGDDRSGSRFSTFV
jgi:hypothetical protein